MITMWDAVLIRESEIEHGYRFMQMAPPPPAFRTRVKIQVTIYEVPTLCQV